MFIRFLLSKQPPAIGGDPRQNVQIEPSAFLPATHVPSRPGNFLSTAVCVSAARTAALIHGEIPTLPPTAFNSDKTAVSIASTAHTAFIADLQKRYSNQLGFLPNAALSDYIDNGGCHVLRHGDQHAGYILTRHHLRPQPGVRPIIQAAIDFDVRRRHLGLQLVEHVAATAITDGCVMLQAWCRLDLEATAFWSAAGFLATAIRSPSNARQSPLILWRRPLTAISARRLKHLPRVVGHHATADATVRLLTADDRRRLLPRPLDG